MPSAKTVSMLELRLRAKEILGQVRAGRPIVLTYRGQPAMRLEPIAPVEADAEDPFYHLADLSKRRGKSLSNREIDQAVYGL
jgi:prevent-host-death family protein